MKNIFFILLTCSLFYVSLRVIAGPGKDPEIVRAKTDHVEEVVSDTLTYSFFEQGPTAVPLQKKVKQKEKKRSPSTGWGLSLAALAGGGGAAIALFLLFRKEKLFRKLSMWGLFNPWKSRLIMAVCHTIIGLGGIWFGSLLAGMKMQVPEWLYLPAGAVSVLGVMMYPSAKKSTYAASYRSRKIWDILIPASALIGAMTFGNNAVLNPSYATTVAAVSEYLPVNKLVYMDHGLSEGDGTGDRNLLEYFRDDVSAGRVLLAIFVFLLVFTVVGALSCVLVCSIASSGSAVIVAILLAFLTVFLSVISARGVIRGGRNSYD